MPHLQDAKHQRVMHLPHELLERVAICADSKVLATLIGSSYASRRIAMQRRIKSLEAQLAGLSCLRPLTHAGCGRYTNWNTSERSPIVLIDVCIDNGKPLWFRHTWTGWDTTIYLITIKPGTAEYLQVLGDGSACTFHKDVARYRGVSRPEGLEAARQFIATLGAN